MCSKKVDLGKNDSKLYILKIYLRILEQSFNVCTTNRMVAMGTDGKNYALSSNCKNLQNSCYCIMLLEILYKRYKIPQHSEF